MANITKGNNGKCQTATDFENVATKMENNLEIVNKNFVKKVLNNLNSIMTVVQRKEDGFFNVILKWFRLYLKLHIRINPDNKKLLKYYDNSAPTVITYIIGCLQFKTKEVPNYHYNLLEILEELLENIQPSVLQKIKKFDIGTIGCLWNPIDLAGDFNTQSKTLKILSVLLKQFDEDRQNQELKCIKWTNLNLFQDKLKTIVQETQLSHVMENSSRELLNNYNMNLSKNVLVYSFYCKTMVLGNKYKFYKPLNLQKFWIDINYCPKTLSYSGRFKLNSDSKYENINVILKIQNIILCREKNILQIHFNNPGEFSKYSKNLSNIKDNVIQFTLNKEECNRLINNEYVIEYFNSLKKFNTLDINTKKEDTINLLKTEMSKNLQKNKKNKSTSESKLCKKCCIFDINATPKQNLKTFDGSETKNSISKIHCESPKTSRIEENATEKLSVRKLRDKKKFFTKLESEDSNEDYINKKIQRKRTQNPKSRQTKSRNKQVCKVTPTVDLTKTENLDSINQNETKSNSEITPFEDISKNSFPRLTAEECDKVLLQVADIFETGDTTYAKPCQSYRNFQTHHHPIQKAYNIKDNTKPKTRKKKNNLEDLSSVGKKRKLTNCYSQENKENINPETQNINAKRGPLSNIKSSTSPHFFETQCSDKTTPANILPEKSKMVFSKNIEIDLTLDGIEQSAGYCKENRDREDMNNENTLSSGSLECEIRSLNENYLKDIDYICTPTKTLLTNSSNLSTPRPTSSMNISNLYDSDMEITQVYNCPISTNTITLQDNNVNMELIQFPNPNFLVEQSSKSHLQTDSKALKENIETPVYLQQILNDFDNSSNVELDSSYKTTNNAASCDVMAKYDSKVLKENIEEPVCLQKILNDNEFDSDYKTPNSNNKHIISNDLAERNYYRNCIVFQHRRDSEESSSSDEDIIHDEFTGFPNLQKNYNKSTNQNLQIMQNSPILNENFCQQADNGATPDKNKRISTNLTTRMVTKCQVTPSAIIMQKIQVSAKKSVLLRSKNPKKVLKVNKCLNDYFTKKNLNNKSVKFQGETFELQSQNLDNLKETNRKMLPRKRPTYYKPQEVQQSFKNNAIFESFSSANSATEIQQQSSSSYSNLNDASKNYSLNCSEYNISHQSTPLENSKKSFRKDLLQTITDYNTKVKLHVNNALCQGLNNISDIYTHKFLEITKAVLKKSDEHKMELEQIHLNIRRLVRELEWQYEAFLNKAKEFDIHKEISERVFESITNIDGPNPITRNNEDVLKQLSIEQNEIFREVWQRYMEDHKI